LQSMMRLAVWGVVMVAGVAAQPASAGNDWWLANLLSNMLTFAVVIVPVGFLVHHLKGNPHLMEGSGPVMEFARFFVMGDPEVVEKVNSPSISLSRSSTRSASRADDDNDVEKGKGNKEKKDNKEDSTESFAIQALKLGGCALGLQGSYLTWGVLQEQIMTQSYGPDKEMFTESQFLVFVNRILAFVVAILITRLTQQPRHIAPLYKYSFTSLSNVMSSWFQYEALKYVSFPTQVLAKASKVIPVMLMGKVVQGKTYPNWEYGIAVGLSLGTAIFMFSKDPGSEEDHERETTTAGMFLLLGYMMFDSFTSNYQSGLFETYNMSKFQMMFGVNLFSCFFTLWSLVNRGKFFGCLDFTSRHPDFMMHVIVLSITSATGQLFIFHTIATYGPLVFTIIMTTRQVMSIFLSAIIFNHSFSSQGWVGVGIVALVLFLKVYIKQQMKKAKKANGPK